MSTNAFYNHFFTKTRTPDNLLLQAQLQYQSVFTIHTKFHKNVFRERLSWCKSPRHGVYEKLGTKTKRNNM